MNSEELSDRFLDYAASIELIKIIAKSVVTSKMKNNLKFSICYLHFEITSIPRHRDKK